MEIRCGRNMSFRRPQNPHQLGVTAAAAPAKQAPRAGVLLAAAADGSGAAADAAWPLPAHALRAETLLSHPHFGGAATLLGAALDAGRALLGVTYAGAAATRRRLLGWRLCFCLPPAPACMQGEPAGAGRI
jgi:hypothetical protein